MAKEVCEHLEHEARAAAAKANMPSAEALEKAANIFRVLGEPSRMKIVCSLLEGELCVCKIVETVGSAQSAVSHQLRVLKDNGIVRSRRDGQNVVYSVADEHVFRILQTGLAHANCCSEVEA